MVPSVYLPVLVRAFSSAQYTAIMTEMSVADGIQISETLLISRLCNSRLLSKKPEKLSLRSSFDDEQATRIKSESPSSWG